MSLPESLRNYRSLTRTRSVEIKQDASTPSTPFAKRNAIEPQPNQESDEEPRKSSSTRKRKLTQKAQESWTQSGKNTSKHPLGNSSLNPIQLDEDG